MNNEPVAWTDKRQLSRPYPHSDAMTMWANAYPEQGIDIPLYTHSVKEQLTDKEIQKIALAELGTEHDWQNIAFARAILRKASEK